MGASLRGTAARAHDPARSWPRARTAIWRPERRDAPRGREAARPQYTRRREPSVRVHDEYTTSTRRALSGCHATTLWHARTQSHPIRPRSRSEEHSTATNDLVPRRLSRQCTKATTSPPIVWEAHRSRGPGAPRPPRQRGRGRSERPLEGGRRSVVGGHRGRGPGGPCPTSARGWCHARRSPR